MTALSHRYTIFQAFNVYADPRLGGGNPCADFVFSPDRKNHFIHNQAPSRPNLIVMPDEVKEILTKPFDGQKPGTSGLRKR